MATSTVEDYIKTLYTEQQRNPGELVALGKLASAMDVVPGTATTMVRALADAGLVNYEPRVGVALSSAGEKLALHVLRRHRLVELFLVEVLKFDWTEVHAEAEELEHAISDKLLEKMDDFLGHPTVDPHGDAIPTASGEIPHRELISITRCASRSQVTIARIDNQDAAFLKYASDHDLKPGSEITIESTSPIAGAITIKKKNGEILALGLQAAEAILVAK